MFLCVGHPAQWFAVIFNQRYKMVFHLAVGQLDPKRQLILAVLDILEIDHALEALAYFIDEIEPESLAVMIAHAPRGITELKDTLAILLLDRRTLVVDLEHDLVRRSVTASLEDRGVEVVAEGQPDALQSLVRDLERGPRAARGAGVLLPRATPGKRAPWRATPCGG